MSIQPIAALTLALKGRAAERVLIFPDGEFRAEDGRPHEVDAWRMNQTAARRLMRQIAGKRGEIPIDYEHQVLRARENGKPAPAAGWYTGLEYVTGEGMYATGVRWTEKARAMIEGLEYRYVSPLFLYDSRTGEPTQLINFALTNTPAIDGLGDLAAASHLLIPQEEPMQQIAKALGLPEDADEAAVLAALNKLMEKAESLEAKLDETSAKLAAASTQAADPDPAKYVPVEQVTALQEQLAALSVEVTKTRVEALVEQAEEEGRLLPAQREWAIKLGLADLSKLQEYIDNAPPIAGLVKQQSDTAKDQETTGLDEAERQVMAALGLDLETFKTAKEDS